MMTQRMLAAVALGLFLGVPGPAKAQYDFTTYDAPGSTRTAVNADSTNAIAGEFDDADGNTHGFVLSKGVYTTLDVPGSLLTVAEGINNRGQIAGLFVDADGNQHGFVLSNGVYTTIDVPGSVSTGVF